jgi:hypothetical protein
VATLIVFGASGPEGRLERTVVAGPAENVAGALNSREWGLISLEDEEGQKIWVNPENVLYVKEYEMGGGAVFT